jgi:hypothetical protein
VSRCGCVWASRIEPCWVTFRHEVGHYYQNILVESAPGASRYLDECRALFGDERADYQAEIARHYKFGPPSNWGESYISEYATMHPWEDFAECFAHYLHITDTIDTAREAGVVLHADRVRISFPRDIAPLSRTTTLRSTGCSTTGRGLSLFFNRVNEAMAKSPLYPFDIPPPVVRKLGFVHTLSRDTAHRPGGLAQHSRPLLGAGAGTAGVHSLSSPKPSEVALRR